MDGSRIILAAHRGEKKYHPENTMPAFIASYEAGVDMIETDLRMTADGELIIMHDRSALRTCGEDKILNDMTLAEVKQLDAGATFDPKFAGTQVPTVREFLEWIAPTGMMVNWELKDYPCDVGEEKAFECADKLVALIREFGMEKKSMMNSFSSRVLEHIYKKYNQEFIIHGQGIFKCRRSKDDPEIPEEEIFDWCCCYPEESGQSVLDYPDSFKFCDEHNILTCLLLPDDVEHYQKALDLGCKMFTSNDIASADAVLRQLGVR